MYLFFAILCASGIGPALIAENINLLAYPFGITPLFIAIYFTTPDHKRWLALGMAAGVALVIGVVVATFPQIPW